MTWKNHIPNDVQELYEIVERHHAAAILATEFSLEFNEICDALRKFEIGKEDILAPGGSESAIPKRFSEILRPLGWREGQLKARLVANGKDVIFDTHKVDYLKGRVAFDLEWNSKDQTFDRDLFAFRSFLEFNQISVGVLVTRSTALQSVFKLLGVGQKYGASTTHMDKLLPRLRAGREGGCPVLAFGITERLITGLGS